MLLKGDGVTVGRRVEQERQIEVIEDWPSLPQRDHKQH